MNQFDCPFCKSQCDSNMGSCVGCGRRFPWLEADDSLRSEIKEREPSRVRATLTLISEIFDYLRQGKPISQAAVKGFAFSFLLPRVAVYLGSLAGVIILIYQSYILSKQTTLLQYQAEAAQVERAQRLEDRISRLDNYVAALLHIERTIKNDRLPKCTGACRTDFVGDHFPNIETLDNVGWMIANGYQPAMGLEKDKPLGAHDFKAYVLSTGDLLAGYLYQLRESARATTLSTPSAPSPFETTIRPAMLMCSQSADMSQRLIRSTQAITSLHGYFKGPPPHLTTPAPPYLVPYGVHPALKYPEVDSEPPTYRDIKVEEVVISFRLIQTDLQTSISDLRLRCETTSKRSTERLRQIAETE